MRHITLDLESHAPPYAQVRSQIARAIEVGDIVPGDRLASIRTLAADLGVAPGTIARAYRELEHEGWIEVGRRGARVRPPAHPPAARRRRLLADAAANFAAEVERIGVGRDSALDAVKQALRGI